MWSNLYFSKKLVSNDTIITSHDTVETVKDWEEYNVLQQCWISTTYRNEGCLTLTLNFFIANSTELTFTRLDDVAFSILSLG